MHTLDEIILKLFNMSVSASWLVLAVIALRLLLRKAPKWINCCLWALVGIRLINPFSFESVLSLIPSAETVTSESFYYSDSPTISTGVEAFNSVVNPIITESLAPTAGASVNPTQILGFVLGTVWLIGMAVMFLYALISFLRLKKTVAVWVNIKDNIYVSDDVQSPFILGIIKPKIYLASDLDEETQSYVISHEKAHIKRRDYLWKPIGFFMLAVYWFNPLMWLSYILLCRDIELACDEKVIKQMETKDKKAYSEALLSCSVAQRFITACPVAFGEVGVKQRIKGVLNYKKPAFWVIAVALAASVAVGVCFVTDPVGEETVTEYQENIEKESENQENVWEFNPLSSASSHAWLTFFFDDVRKLEKVEADFGKSQIDDVLKNAIIWMPSVDEQFDEATVKVYAFRENSSKVVFDIKIKKLGQRNELSTVYSIVPGEGVAMELEAYSEYVFTKPEVEPSDVSKPYTAPLNDVESDVSSPQRVGCYDDNSFTWICNPMAGGTWWYELTFTLPDGYEIKSAKANGGSAIVENVFYNEPDGEKCVEWTPDFNRPIDEEEDYVITINAEKHSAEISFDISVRMLSQNYEDGTKTYIVEPVNCKLTEKQTANYEISPSPIEDLDSAVSQAIMSINGKYSWNGECPAEGHIILGKDEEKDVTKVYVLERFSSFGFENGWFIEVGGHSTACVMTFVSVDGGYVFQDVEYIEDGSHLDDSVKRLFPLRYRKRVISPTQNDKESMNDQCEKYAKAYLEEKGREAKIGSYGDVPRIWLTDLGVSTEVSNILLEMKGRTNACEVGYYEQSGEIYRTLYCEEEKIILYTKELYEKGIVEKTAIDATTGKEVPFKNEYLDTAKGYEDYISEGVKEKEYTTVAVSADSYRKITDLGEITSFEDVDGYSLLIGDELKFKTHNKEEADEITKFLMWLNFSEGFYAHYSSEDLEELTEYQIAFSCEDSAQGTVIRFDKDCNQMWFIVEDGSFSSSYGVINSETVKEFFKAYK